MQIYESQLRIIYIINLKEKKYNKDISKKLKR